jgi:probable phosphoglycerate mutase
MVERVLLARHGETDLNRSGVLRGQIDVPLSPYGVREAQRLGERIGAEYPLTAVYASPLLRARATAEAIGRAAGLEVLVDARFSDMDYGPWAGRRPDSFTPAEAAEFRRWQEHPAVPLPGAEDPRVVQQRALEGLAACAAAEVGCIAIVAHEAILQLILCDVMSLGLERYRDVAQHTATLNELERHGSGWRVRLLNSTSHLDEIGSR